MCFFLGERRMYHTGEDLSLHGEQALRGAQDTVGFTPHICKGNHDEGWPLEVEVHGVRVGLGLERLLIGPDELTQTIHHLMDGIFAYPPEKGYFRAYRVVVP